ncbi:MAG: ORF6C domain-containing protein [Vallitalea sp.]|jgi:hypothetical protein|nr:ORF6C domain-containing protein [Vallitalea sp.]
MHNLAVIEHQKQRVLLTTQLAEGYGASARNIHDNFNNHKLRFQEGKHFYLLQGEELKKFLQHDNIGVQNPSKTRRLYLWTEKGALHHAKILDTDKAWEVYEELEDTYFRVKKTMSYEDMIILQAESVKELKADVQENARRIDKLNDETYVTPEQKNYLQLARNKRVVELIGYRTKAYNDTSFRNRVYAELGRQYKNYFKISSYGYTLKNRYEEAIKLIDSYNLSMELSMQLDIINSQKIA